jgi:membrane-associated phospholipid phosphatase
VFKGQRLRSVRRKFIAGALMERALVIIFRGGQRTMTTAVADRREPRASGILGSVQADVTLSFCKWATVSGNVTARGVMCCLVVTLLIVARVHAQAPQLAPEDAPIARWEIPVTVVGIATALTASALLNPANCRWCERTPAGGDAVNALDRSARDTLLWSEANIGKADALGYVTVYAPFALALVHRDLDKRGILTVVESLTATSFIAQTVKVATARERPSFHYQSPASMERPKDRNTSFVSEHSAEAFALLASTTRATAARHRPTMWLWIAGVPLAAATGYFRIAADRHYLTDVLAGAGVGLSVGYGVPALNPPRSGKRPAVTPSVQAHGGQVMATWVW